MLSDLPDDFRPPAMVEIAASGCQRRGPADVIERLSKPVDKAYLRRAALYYLQRYASSVDNVRRVLLRKAQRRAGPDGVLPVDLDAQIEEVIGEEDDRAVLNIRALADDDRLDVAA